MRFTKPINEDVVPYTTVKIDGCADTKIGFQLLSAQPSVSKRRYCNKVLVHECISVPELDPLDIEHVEFLATSDPCYSFFEIFKSSIQVEDIEPTIDLQLNDDDLAIGFLVNFASDETCGRPLRLAYRVYAYFTDDPRLLIAQGQLFITPCCCEGISDCEGCLWTDVTW